MKMARADRSDLEAAILLCCILGDVFNDGVFPRGTDGEFDENGPDRFDEDDADHLRALFGRLRHCMDAAPGGLFRVILGMDTLCRPENGVIDPHADSLELHPDLVKARAAWTQGQADVGFLVRRAMRAGCFSMPADRDFGISSNSLVAIAYGIQTPDQQEMPHDADDLAACERAFAALPEHRRTPDAVAALERARKAVAR